MNIIDVGIWAGMFVVILIAIGLILTRLYHRTTKEVSFVRTGFGGQRVIMNGGAMVFPILHEIILGLLADQRREEDAKLVRVQGRAFRLEHTGTFRHRLGGRVLVLEELQDRPIRLTRTRSGAVPWPSVNPLKNDEA